MSERVRRVFQEVFDNDDLAVSDTLSQETFSDWDSFAQVKLMIGLEEEFNVKFSIEEVIEASSVGNIKSMLRAKGVAD